MGAAAQKFGLSFVPTPSVLPAFQALSGLPLARIRSIYDSLFTQAERGTPFVRLTVFQATLSQLRLRNADAIAAVFSKPPKKLVNYLHFVTALTLFASTHWFYKVKCNTYTVVFSMFDFDGSGGISGDEMVIMGSAVIMGICAMTGFTPPTGLDLHPVLNTLFQEIGDEASEISLEWYCPHSLFKWAKDEPQTISILRSNEPPGSIRERDALFESMQQPGTLRRSLDSLSKPTPRKAKKKLSVYHGRLLKEVFEEVGEDGKAVQSKFVNELVERGLCHCSILAQVQLFDTEKTFPELLGLVAPVSHLLKEEEKAPPPPEIPTLTMEKIEEYRRLFEVLDQDCSGCLDEDELVKGLELHSRQEVQEMLQEYDIDRNKTLEFYEFVKMLCPAGISLPAEFEKEYQGTKKPPLE